MVSYTKYPRTFHFPWSPGTSSDDRFLSAKDVEYFNNKKIVVTEKLDGENTSMYRDHIHARSMDSRAHPSQTWVRQFHSQIRNEIPIGWRICGENMYAKHSIYYDKLDTFFYVFSVWNEKNECLSWDDTKEFCLLVNTCIGLNSPFILKPVPVLYEGIWDIDQVKACWTGKSNLGEAQEGYVCRNVESFPYPMRSESKHEMPVFVDLAKFVRAKHVQSDSHWRVTWTPNKLIGS